MARTCRFNQGNFFPPGGFTNHSSPLKFDAVFFFLSQKPHVFCFSYVGDEDHSTRCNNLQDWLFLLPFYILIYLKLFFSKNILLHFLPGGGSPILKRSPIRTCRVGPDVNTIQFANLQHSMSYIWAQNFNHRIFGEKMIS